MGKIGAYHQQPWEKSGRGARISGWGPDSEIWLHYRENVAINPLLEQAAQRALYEIVIYIGKTYQGLVPSRRVARSVSFAVRPPRAYVGPNDFRANFFESGAQPHRILARGVRLKKRRYKRYTKIVGFQKGIRYMAIPVGGKAIFRTRVEHPGMYGGHYMKRVGEVTVPVVEALVARAFQDAFR